MRRNHLPRLSAALVALLAATLALAPHARRASAQQPRGSGIDTYAITGARIVPVAGAEIPRGTVVVRGGLIAAVGANVAAPPDARVIDGAGLTVYPGLIDANSNLGVPAPTPAARPAGAGGGGGVAALLLAQAQATPAVSAPNSAQPAGLQPEVMAEDIIRPGGDQIESARSSGITAALTAPREGIFIGQSAFINLAGDTPQQMIVRSPVALHVGFTPLRTGVYPGSLLGVFASLRQMMLDAQRYREANAVYEKNPRGLRRPDQDRSYAALLPALARQMPVVMQANTQREIERALDLAQEFNLRAVIAGGGEAWKVADRLAAAKVPVLLSLNFPRRTAAPSPEADPDPLRVLRERVEAPKNAGRLAAAGVRFAFQSGGMANAADFMANAARAVENGLARDEAVRAMTLRAAEILGVAEQLGTIEVGKIANLTVTRGDIFDRNRRVAHVFIDGRPVELRPAAAPAAAAAGATGTWAARVTFEGQPERSMTLTLQQQGERLTGSVQGDFGSAQIANASVGAGGDIKFTVPLTTNVATREATFTGTITGNEMRGTVQAVEFGSGTFTATRAGGAQPAGARPGGQRPPEAGTPPPGGPAADLTGTWTLTISLPGQSLPATLTLRQEGENLSGTLQSTLGSSQVTGSAGADGFRFTTTVELGGRATEITFASTASGNQISGTASSMQGNATFTGTRPQA